MENVLVVLIVCASVWYLAKGFIKSFNAHGSSCSCSGKKACAAVMKMNKSSN